MRLRPEFLALVRSGKKISTIRSGHRRVLSQDLLILFDELGNEVAAKVTDVVTKLVRELNDSDAKNDGFDSLSKLVEVLDDIYPGLSADDVVTVISFKPITGVAADD